MKEPQVTYMIHSIHSMQTATLFYLSVVRQYKPSSGSSVAHQIHSHFFFFSRSARSLQQAAAAAGSSQQEAAGAVLVVVVTASVAGAAVAVRAAAAAALEHHRLAPSELPLGIMGGRRWRLTLVLMTSLPSWRRWNIFIISALCHSAIIHLRSFLLSYNNQHLPLVVSAPPPKASLSMDEAARQTSSHSLSSASSSSATIRQPGSSQRQHRRTGSVGTVSEHEVK